MKWHPWNRRVSERGSVLIWLALIMIVVLAFVALGIDGAKLMATRTQLQNAADAGALAGASMFDPETGRIVGDAAIAEARKVAELNKAFIAGPQPVSNASVQISSDGQECEVTVIRSGSTAIVTHLAQVVGVRTLDAIATATARISKPDSVCEVLVPFGGVPPAGGVFLTGCENTYNLTLEQHAGPGNYQLVDFPKCDEGPCAGKNPPGGSTLRCYIANGYPCCVGIWNESDEESLLVTEPGRKIGPVKQGLEDRFDADYVKKTKICYSDYLTLGGTGQRVINVPLIENFEANGRKQVRVKGFAAFFLQDKPSNLTNKGVRAEFLYDVVPGRGQTGTGTVYRLSLIR